MVSPPKELDRVWALFGPNYPRMLLDSEENIGIWLNPKSGSEFIDWAKWTKGLQNDVSRHFKNIVSIENVCVFQNKRILLWWNIHNNALPL